MPNHSHSAYSIRRLETRADNAHAQVIYFACSEQVTQLQGTVLDGRVFRSVHSKHRTLSERHVLNGNSFEILEPFPSVIRIIIHTATGLTQRQPSAGPKWSPFSLLPFFYLGYSQSQFIFGRNRQNPLGTWSCRHLTSRADCLTTMVPT